MSALPVSMLSRAEARSLTDEVKGDAERLWRKLVELYEGGAHEVLGHKSWGAYFKAEFGGSQSRAYELLDAGRVVKAIPQLRNEAQARALTPLKKKPAQMREAWAEVVDLHPEPTAKQVREVVARHTDAPKRSVQTPHVVRALQELYEATQATPLDELVAWGGDRRRLARQWACVQVYLTQLHKASKTPVPKVVKGQVV